jgi:hypothetical protein
VNCKGFGREQSRRNRGIMWRLLERVEQSYENRVLFRLRFEPGTSGIVSAVLFTSSLLWPVNHPKGLVSS